MELLMPPLNMFLISFVLTVLVLKLGKREAVNA